MLAEVSNKFLNRFEKSVDKRDSFFIEGCLAPLHPADISELLHEFNAEDSKYVLSLLDPQIGAEIISELEEDVREKFLKTYDSKELSKFLIYIDSDDIADILQDQKIEVREQTLSYLFQLDEEKAANTKELLRYEEDTAGGMMAKEFISANLNWTVIQCIEEIRRQKTNVNKVHAVYVVDDNYILQGRVSLRRIILAEDDTLIKDIYDSDISSIQTYEDEEEVVSIMQKYDLEAVPVVDVNGRLVGRITIDDAVDVILEQAEEDMQLMSGISEDVEESDTVWMLTKAKLPWLMIGVIGGLFGAYFMEFFEKDLLLIPALSFFVPLIMATGGNVGIQSSSLIVQSLATKSLIEEKLIPRLSRALIVACINGLVIACLVFSYNFFFGESVELAFVVSISLFSVVVLASIMGTITPLILDRVGINPALASGPFITTFNDLIGLAVYFIVAHILYF